MKRICHLYNYPSHYRLKIYQMLDEAYGSKFVFGDEPLKIKPFDLTSLKDAVKTHVGTLGHFVTQWGIIPYIFKKYDYYVMTVGTNNLSHWLFLLLAKLFRKKKVYMWCHGLYGYESKGQRMVRKMYFSLCDGIFLYGNFARELMIRQGYSGDKLHVIHNSLNYDEQLAIRQSIHASNIYRQHFSNDYPVLLFIGRLTAVKKLDMLVEAHRQLAKEGQHYNLVFVGDGVEKEKLEAMVIDNGMQDKVWFYGACYDEHQNAELIYNADLCVSPGNVGLTSIHSLMFGTPVLTHDNFTWQMPEFEAIKDGETGAFFEYQNVNSLASKISSWFGENKDRREVVRQACFAVIDKDWNPYYQMNVFKNVLDE